MRTIPMAATGKEKQETYKDRQKKYMGQERMGGGVGGQYKMGRKSLSGDQCVQCHWRDNYAKATDSVWLSNVAEAGWDRIKGVRGQQRQEGGKQWLMKTLSYRLLEEDRTPHFITVTHAHTRLCQCWSPENTLGTLWSRRHLAKSLMSLPKDIHPRKFLFTDWPWTNLCPHIASRVWRQS